MATAIEETVPAAKTTTTMKHGEGLRQYYQQHIHDLQLLVRHKTHNLNRLEAQRNDLNSKGLSPPNPNPKPTLDLLLFDKFFCCLGFELVW